MDLSAGRASPMPAAISRCGSRVEFSLITVNATWPGLRCFRPSLREMSLQLGGKIEETRTMLHAAMLALFAHTLGQEDLLRNERHGACRAAVPPRLSWGRERKIFLRAEK